MSTNVITELSEDQIEELKVMFNLFDQDGNQTITIKELGLCMRALGQNITQGELAAIIAEIDADGNGIIEFPEFVDLMSRRPWGIQGSEAELKEAFSSFDKTGEGYVSAAEVRRMLTTMGEALTDEELDQMMLQIPKDGDGMIPYAECVRMMMEPAS